MSNCKKNISKIIKYKDNLETFANSNKKQNIFNQEVPKNSGNLLSGRIPTVETITQEDRLDIQNTFMICDNFLNDRRLMNLLKPDNETFDQILHKIESRKLLLGNILA